MMKLNILHTLLPLLAVVAAGCVNDDTDFSSIIGDDTEQKVTPIDIALDFSTLTEEADTPVDDPDDPFYADYVENDTFDRTVYIAYDGTSVTVSGDSDRVDIDTSGGHVTVNSQSGRMEYVLTGKSADGSFKIYSEHKFKLTLDGLTLTNPTGAAINDQCGKTVCLVLADGTTSTLADGATYDIPSGEQMKGAIFSEGQIVVSGGGELVVNATGGHGIVSDDYIRFRPGCRVAVYASAGHGVKTNDGVYIDGGVLNISVSADGYKGIKSESDIEVNGGRTTVITSGSSRLNIDEEAGEGSYSSCSGLKSDYGIYITGGTLAVKSAGEGGKGINATTDLAISGGNVAVVTTGARGQSAPKGIKCDADIRISGGSTYTYSAASEPLEAGETLTVAEGYTTYEVLARRVIISY